MTFNQLNAGYWYIEGAEFSENTTIKLIENTYFRRNILKLFIFFMLLMKNIGALVL